MEYKSLEARMFDTYYKLSVSESVVKNIYGESDELDLCRFMRNVYSLLTENPQLLSKAQSKDDAHPQRFNCASYGKPKLKINMRKTLKTVSDFMQFVWNLKGNCNIKIPLKYKDLLRNTTIVIEDGKLISEKYPRMFNMITRLYISDNGFERFIRSVYDDYTSYKSVFGNLFDNSKLFNDFTRRLEKKGYKYKANINYMASGGAKTFEGVNSYWLKNIYGNETPKKLSMYDHDNYGVHISFSALLKDQLLLLLLIQDVRKVIDMFDELDEKLQIFIIKHHARCDNCGYCTQRSKNRTVVLKPYAKAVKHNGKTHLLCPINYVYTYCWNYIDEELIEGILLYLDLQNKMIRSDVND